MVIKKRPTKSMLNITSPESAAGPPGLTKPYPKATKTGTVSFKVPKYDIETSTWYSLWGELSSSTVPLICLHGGPGVGHNYLLPCALLATPSRPVILYDQLGCGNSTHLRDRKGDTDFWTPGLFMAELDNLKAELGISEFDLLGQSWGGMLGATYATTRPKGLRKLVICDSPASMVTWVETANELRKLLPKEAQETLTRCEKEGRTDTEEYEEAVMVFYHKFVCRVDPFPQEFLDTMEVLKKDDTVYLTMNGPSEFFVSGSLKTWSIVKELHKVNVPTMLVNGYFDEAQDITMQPFFDEIPGKVKWIRFAESSHMPQIEESDAFIEGVGRFLDT